MKWNPEQIVVRGKLLTYATSASGDKPFILAGLAGSGKTTLVCAVVAELVEEGHRVAVVTPTGKAAAVFNSKQKAVRAQTIHSLLYKRPFDALKKIYDRLDELEAEQDNGARTPAGLREMQALTDKLTATLSAKGKLSFEKRPPEDVRKDYDVVFVDEASMVGPDLVAALRDLCLPTVYLGDPNQLYPVGMHSFAVALDRPDAKLVEIMRQGAGSPILTLSRAILAHKGLPAKSAIGVACVAGTNPLPIIERMGWDTQFIVFRNATRRTTSRTIRHAGHGAQIDKKYPFLPFVGERLMIDANSAEQKLLKGDIIEITEPPQYLPKKALGVDSYLASVTCVDQRGVSRRLSIQLNDLMLSEGSALGVEPAFGDKKGNYKFPFYAGLQGTQVMFPYAITCHKAQGSEWKNVALHNEGPRDQNVQYLYTGVTRAADNLTLIGVY